MIEVISILALTFFVTSTFALYQHYRYHYKQRIIKKQDQINSDQRNGRLWLLSQGYIEKENILNLISDDGGINWHVIKHGVEDPPILGTLEETHREVFLHPKAWERLKDHVRRNGAISLQDEQGVKLLEKAGFEVRVRAC